MDHHGTLLTSQQNCKGCDYEHPGTLCESPLIRMKTGALLNGSCNTSDNPPIVCLCGSTRFGEAFRTANLAETLAGKIVLSVGCYMRSDAEIFADNSPDEPAGIRFVSVEPMLGPVDVSEYSRSLLPWVICGGMTGKEAKPMQAQWVRLLRDQCRADGRAFFFKGWGEWGPNWLNDDNGQKIEGSEWMDRMGKRMSGQVLDGREWKEFPA